MSHAVSLPLVSLSPFLLASSSPIVSATFQLLGAAAIAVILVWAVRARRSSHRAFLRDAAGERVCPHLKPAYDLLVARGHRPVNVGQRHPDLPLEIHVAPAFGPQTVYDELKLAPPVFVSERNVLYCKDDLCEIHPVRD
jgi:hypothetical protein